MKSKVTDALGVKGVNESYDVHMVFDEGESSVDSTNSSERKLDKLTEMMSSLVLMHTELKSKMSVIENEVSMVKKEMNMMKRSRSSTLSDLEEDVNLNITNISGDHNTRLLIDNHGNKFLKFERGDTNSKGGLYSFNYGERIYLTDEKKFGQVIGEIQYYCWIKVDGEDCKSNNTGRRKLKPNVKKSLPYNI